MKKLNLKIVAIFVGLLLSLTSCFEIREELTLKTKESGSYKFALDMGQVIQMAKAFQQASDSAKDENSELDQNLDDIFEESDGKFAGIQNVPGISNFKDLTDGEKGVLAVSFDFANIEALNGAIKEMSKDSVGLKKVDMFTLKKGQLTRHPSPLFMVDGMISSILDDEDSETAGQLQMMKGLFSSGSYELNVTVPKKVKKFTNEAGNIQNTREFVMDIPLDKLFEHPEYLDYTLYYK